MRQVNLFIMSATMMLASCGGTKDAGKTDQALIGKSDIKIEGKRMTPEALWAMGRIGGLSVSPDGKHTQNANAHDMFPAHAARQLADAELDHEERHARDADGLTEHHAKIRAQGYRIER